MSAERNTFLDNGWTLQAVDDLSLCDSFDCGDRDLNEYFHKDVRLHKQELLTQTYCFYETTSPDLILAFLDFCNDAIQIEAVEHPSLGVALPIDYPFYPSVKLTRIGVKKEFRGMHVGSTALNLAKKFFTTDNRTGCRFMTVDAYDTNRVINFYKQNGFKHFPSKVKSEGTKPLFFDLKRYNAT